MGSKDDVWSWEQLGLFPSDVVQITARIGIVSGSDHCQFQVEASHPDRGTVIAMWALPHRSLADAPEALDRLIRRMRELVHEHTGPF